MADERKLATVLFADLTGSTELGASQDPERTRALLDRFYDAMTAEIEAAGGTIEKFAGDAVMAVFGAPAAHEDHAERALHAALSMQRRLDALFEGALSLHIGINTGEVVVGRAREGSSFVTGDSVNEAARLEQGAEPGEILVGERTVAAVRGAFEFEAPRVIEAKGKPEGITARNLIRALTLMRPRGVGGLNETFVGRDAELTQLLNAYRAAATNAHPKLVTVVGDAGVGKTRLLRELWRQLESETPSPLRRTGRCLAYGHGITYWSLGEVLKEHLGILESDSPEDVRARLGENQILGLTLGLDVAADLHPLAARDRLRDAWIRFLESLTSERPLVVLVEDIHWAEDPLLDLLERLARDVEGPLLLVATARPDFVDRCAGWGVGRLDAETVWLDPLTDESARRLVDDLLSHELPAEFRDHVVATTEGNPFFVEEVLAALIDRGLLVRKDGGWSLNAPPDALVIPDSVLAVLAARIDLLEPAEKGALQAAAVIGRIFWTGPVYELIEVAQPDFRVLEDRDFIRRRSGSSLQDEPEYAFKHALTREVAYASVPKARRAQLHASFAEWLERLGARDEHASLLAHHYAQAVRPEDADLAWIGREDELRKLRKRAVEWLRRAAELAVGRYELGDGVEMLQQALALQPGASEQAESWRLVGRAHALRYDGEAFWSAMLKAIELCPDRERLADYYSELALETSGRSGMWNRVPDRALVQGWIDKALELAGPQTHARARALVAQAYWAERKDPAVTQEAKQLADRLGDRDLVFDVSIALVTDAFALGRYHEALAEVRRSMELAKGRPNPEVETIALEETIPPHVMCGHIDEARRFAMRHVDLAANLSTHHRLHSVALMLEVEEVCGGWTRVCELTTRTREAVAENLATPCIRNARNLLVCAAGQAITGDFDEAKRLEEEAGELGMEGWEYILETPRLRLALARNELDVAERLTIKPFTVRRQIWFFTAAAAAHLDALAALRDRARVEADAQEFLQPGIVLEPFALRALGIVREDETLLAKAVGRFDALGLDWHAAETRAVP